MACRGVPVESLGFHGYVEFAADRGSTAIISAHLAAGGGHSKRDMNMLFVAVPRNKLNHEDGRKRVFEIVRMLLENGMEADGRFRGTDYTALERAVIEQDVGMLMLLLEWGQTRGM